MDDKPFKQVNVAKDDWHSYNQTAIKLSAVRGKRVSIPALLKEAYASYINTVDIVNK